MAKKVKMAVRVLNSSSSSSSLLIDKSQYYHTINNLLFMPYSPKSILRRPSLYDVICKVLNGVPAIGTLYNERQRFHCSQRQWIHSGETPVPDNNEVKQAHISENLTMVDGDAPVDKVKRKKLKGKRAVVRWLKMFRYKKKKEYERMTTEEKILYKLRKARKKEERYLDGLKKIEPSESSETAHDPEILTPEEHFCFLKMGLKSRNYVPIGRRGIYQGVILNMHLHWKKHQTLQVIVKTFTAEEVKEIAAELARLSGGIVLDIHEENTIIMYRGKNYVQPPTEIMSPRITLSRKKALDKSKYRDGLRAVRKYIPRLEQDLDLLQEQAKNKPDYIKPESIDESQNINNSSIGSKKLREMMASKNNMNAEEDEHLTDSDSEALSDIFETDSDTDTEERVETPLYLNAFEKFQVEKDENSEDFETHLSRLSAAKKGELIGKDVKTPDLDEVDQMFLRAASLLKKKRR